MAQRNECSEIVLGLLWVLGTNILIFIFLLALAAQELNHYDPKALALIFGICLYQLLYVVPAIIWLKWEQRWGLMKGVIIGAVITALLSGPCFVSLLGAPS